MFDPCLIVFLMYIGDLPMAFDSAYMLVSDRSSISLNASVGVTRNLLPCQIFSRLYSNSYSCRASIIYVGIMKSRAIVITCNRAIAFAVYCPCQQ
nr:MAG TPA: hypothetical protein [Bacteriophage sp.]